MTIMSAIELGSHTARLLVVETRGSGRPWKALGRGRIYTRLAEGFTAADLLDGSAVARAVEALRVLMRAADDLGGRRPFLVATGVVRSARNRVDFLADIAAATGLTPRLISGEEEARLTSAGVLWALGIKKGPYVIFDLGGGTTEFSISTGGPPVQYSIPLGAAVLTERWLTSDPPRPVDLSRLADDVDLQLAAIFDGDGAPVGPGTFLAGTGGTAVTLAALWHRVPADRIGSAAIDGLRLQRGQVEALLRWLAAMPLKQRRRVAGLDEGRAPLIVAGAMVVARIMNCLDIGGMTVSLSDLLEGILLEELKGEING